MLGDARPSPGGLGAPGGDDHVGGEAGDHAQEDAPDEQFAASERVGDAEELDHHIQDGAGGNGQEDHAQGIAGELMDW